VLFVLRPDLGDAGVGEHLDRARQVLGQQGASDIRVLDWGVRDLAYRIETHHRGRFVLMQYEGPPAAVAELERTFKISDQVLRYMSVRQEPGAAGMMAGPMGPGGEEARVASGGEEERESGRGAD
jgi:small subunit ribosomal protein S6